MPLDQLVQSVIENTKASLWPWFAPECILSITIMVMLLLQVTRIGRAIGAFWTAFAGTLLALYFTILPSAEAPGELFTGMLVLDSLTSFIRALLLLFVALLLVLTQVTRFPAKRDAADIYTLILGSTIGMCLMASANHLLMIFLAVEMASVPSYALAGVMRGKRQSSEAGLKYAVYGAGAAGIMLYGISLLAGLTGSAHLPTIAERLASDIPNMQPSETMVLVLSGLMILVGVSFKLAAFPFHFWCPDVFEGASAEVGAFLSVASKAAALALLVRIAFGVGTVPNRSFEPPTAKAAASQFVGANDAAETSPTNDTGVAADGGDADAKAETNAPAPAADRTGSLQRVRDFLALLIGFLAAVTCTFGNLAAYGQTNMKRLLAYSTIAHAGYMMLAVPAALLMYESDQTGAMRAIAGLGIYLGVYLFMNLGAFAVVAILREAIGSEEIADYAGLVNRFPMVVVCTGLILFSLVGIPPLAGFVGKFAIFASLAEGYSGTGRVFLLLLLVVGGLNTAISLYYYLRVVKVMAIDPESERSATMDWSLVGPAGMYLTLVTAPLLLLFVTWSTLSEWALAAASQLFT